jgi:glycosyltransferase involved in cell wall biosynthesis
MPEVFRVAICGAGGTASRHLPYPTYPVRINQLDMSVPELPWAWQDFAGDEEGIILVIWNPSWLEWMVNPARLPMGDLRLFLQGKQFKKWLYAPIDGMGPAGTLPRSQKAIFEGFDRLLAPTSFGAEIIESTVDGRTCDAIPHGIHTDVFFQRSRKEARERFMEDVANFKGRLTDEIFLLSAVATNTPRKDWGLCFEVCQELLARGQNVGLWAHTDLVQKQGAWDLLMLQDELGMENRVIFTSGHLTDEQMSWGYAACDVALSIGSGEGWGYTAAEALACGLPCIHGNYAGSPDFIPGKFLVYPRGYRLDGFYGIRRPVFNSDDWASSVMMNRGVHAELDPKFSWEGCWPAWHKWLLEGIQG